MIRCPANIVRNGIVKKNGSHHGDPKPTVSKYQFVGPSNSINCSIIWLLEDIAMIYISDFHTASQPDVPP